MHKKRVIIVVKAFTLIELIVSVGIMTLVLGITLMQKPEATLKLSLSDSMYTLELMVRQAQLQGSAITSSGNIYGGAGVFLTLASSTEALRFRDRVDKTISSTLGVGNGLYDNSPTNEKDEIVSFIRGNKIKKLCVSMGTSTFFCNSENDPVIKNLTLSFNRPSPSINIYINNSTSTNYASACVQMESLKAPNPGHIKSLYLYRAGLVVDKAKACQ